SSRATLTCGARRPKPWASATKTEAELMKLVLLAFSGALALSAGGGVVISGHSPSRGSGRPGPDSATVSRMFKALGTADPVVCELAARQLGNGWNWSGDRDGISMLRDHSADDHAIQEMFQNDVTDPKA